MKTKIISALALSIASLASAQAATITAWSFENNAVATNNNPTPSTGTGTASSMGMNLYATPNVGITKDDIVVGATTDTGINGNANLTDVWRVRGQAGTSGAANGWSSLAPIGMQGAEFAASTAGFGSINVSFDWFGTNQGEANLQLEYTNNGGATWINTPINIGTNADVAVVTNSTSANTVMGSYIAATGGQDWFTGLTATINDPLAANNPNFAIAMVNASTGADNISMSGTALNNTSGNWRFDNVVISGTAAVAAVPVPAAVWLFGSALAGFMGFNRRKSA
jgi:hypothetical protein